MDALGLVMLLLSAQTRSLLAPAILVDRTHAALRAHCSECGD